MINTTNNEFKIPSLSSKKVRLNDEVINPLLWSAEQPNLYYLTISVIQDGNETHSIGQQVGFRKIELKSGQVLVNNQPVLFKGVNRQPFKRKRKILSNLNRDPSHMSTPS